MKHTLAKFLITLLSGILPVTCGAQLIIRTIAGTGNFGNGFSGNNGPAATADLGGLYGVCADTAGNIYFTDQYNYVIRRINRNGIVKTIAGTGFPGNTGDGGPASAARLSVVQPIIIDAAGNLYVGDAGNKVVRKISSSGIITRIAGDPSVLTYGTGDGGQATNAGLGSVSGLALDGAGNLYIADGNTRLRKVTPAGIISTVAGGTIGSSGDGGPATAAAFDGLSDIAIDKFGNKYVTDKNSCKVRKISTSGIVSLFAGTGTCGLNGEGGPATSARLNGPSNVSVDTLGNVYISDQNNNRIRRVNTSGIINTYAGSVGGFAGDGGVPTAAKLSYPAVTCFDRRGNMYIADKSLGIPGGNTWGRRIRQIYKVDTFGLTVAPGPVLCGNTFAAFTAHPVFAYYSFIYKWYKNGLPVGVNSPTYSSPTIANNDTITCKIVDTANGGQILAISTPIIMTVLPPMLPVLHITSTGDTVCAGLPITFTATATNGGSAPIFKWYVLGVLRWVGPVFTYIPMTGDIVTCELTSNDPCAFPNTVHAEIPLSVIPSFLPTIIVTPSDTLISYWSQIVTMFTNVTYGGTNPTYQWYNSDGPIAGATSSSYFQEIYAPDTFYCVMHSDAFCAVPEIDTSNFVRIGTGTLTVNDASSAHSAFAVYPNPNNGQFTIKGMINTAAGHEIRVEVKNVLGQSLFTHSLDNISGQTALPADLGNSPAGVYFLVIYDDNGRRAIPFVIK